MVEVIDTMSQTDKYILNQLEDENRNSSELLEEALFNKMKAANEAKASTVYK